MQAVNAYLRKFLCTLDESKLTQQSCKDIQDYIIESWNTDAAQVDLKHVLSQKPTKTPRAKNPYILYCQEHREDVKRGLPCDHKNPDVMKELGKRWQLLTSSTDPNDMVLLTKYTKQANEEKELLKKNFFVHQSEHTQNSTKKTKKQITGKKRAKNPYVLYCQDHRELVKQGLPEGYKPPDVMSELGKRWKALVASTEPSDAELVNKYKEMSANEKSLLSQNSAAPCRKNYTEEKFECCHCHNYGEGGYDNSGFFYCDNCWIIYHGCEGELNNLAHKQNIVDEQEKESKKDHKVCGLVQELFGSDSEDDN